MLLSGVFAGPGARHRPRPTWLSPQIMSGAAVGDGGSEPPCLRGSARRSWPPLLIADPGSTKPADGWESPLTPVGRGGRRNRPSLHRGVPRASTCGLFSVTGVP